MEVLVDITERQCELSTSSEAGESPLTSPSNPIHPINNNSNEYRQSGASNRQSGASNRQSGASYNDFRNSTASDVDMEKDIQISVIRLVTILFLRAINACHTSAGRLALILFVQIPMPPGATLILVEHQATKVCAQRSAKTFLRQWALQHPLHVIRGDICRICHCGRELEPLIRPCRCDGSTKFTHQSCLLSWFQENNQKKNKCELCLYEIKVVRKGIKPLYEWKCPPRALRDIVGVPSIYAVLVFVCACIILLVITKGCVTINCLLGYLPFLIAIALAIKYCGCIDYMRIYGRKWLMINEEWRILEYQPTQYRTTYVIVASPAPCGSECKLAEVL